MLSENDPFYDALEKTLLFQAHRYIPPAATAGECHVQPEYPTAFYDRHVTTNLQLKRVQIIPNMDHLLSDLCEEEIRAFNAASHRFDPAWYTIPRSNNETTLGTSWGVGYHYQATIGASAARFPSKLYICPDNMSWISAFIFKIVRDDDRRPIFTTEGSLEVPYSYSDPQYRHDLSEDALSDLRDLQAHSPQLAIWQFYQFDLSGEKLLKAMQRTTSFEWETPRTICMFNNSSDLPRPLDGHASFLSTLLRTRVVQSTVNSKSTGHLRSRKSKASNNTVVPSVPNRAVSSSRPYRVNYTHFLQHAWSRAVANDATFIVLHCGKYERIGVRHRASQTLFLSGIINTMTCQNPAYGKLHVGLHIAIVQDALSRQQMRRNLAVAEVVRPIKSSNSLKRPHASSQENGRSQKRQKPNSERSDASGSECDPSFISAALSQCDLALVSLNYGSFRSPLPSSFIRLGPPCTPGFYKDSFKEPSRKVSYKADQCFSLSLSEPMGWGSTGVVHRGSAQVFRESGMMQTHPVIVKFVFSQPSPRMANGMSDDDDQTSREDKLWNEYQIYQHLARAGVVEGILPVYGLFEDVDSGTLALIMDDGGVSLTHRRLEKAGEPEFISEKERNELLQSMKAIHKAGIRHCDIRSDNILVNSREQPFIVDFDRAERGDFPSEATDRELLCMQHIVDGHGDTTKFYSY